MNFWAQRHGIIYKKSDESHWGNLLSNIFSYDTMLDTHPEFANLDPIQTEVSLQTLIVDEENE